MRASRRIIATIGGGHKPGDVIDGRFSLVERLGAGTFGAVWRAVDGVSQKPVAVKILRPEAARVGWVVERFAREIETLSVLRHENLALAIAGAVDDSEAYLAMELVEGETLTTYLASRSEADRPLEDAEVLQIFRALTRGVDYAHSRRVIHRDLKPKNIMLATDGQLKILDFGVAKLASRGPHDATTVGRVLGSILYMSPEQFQSKPIDHRVDVFALGAILFELLTLRKAWAFDQSKQPMRLRRKAIGSDAINNFTTVMERIVEGERPRVTDFRQGAPRMLDTICQRAMAADPEVRFSRAKDMWTALSSVFVPKEIRRRPNRALIAGASLSVGLLGAVLVAPTEESPLPATESKIASPDFQAKRLKQPEAPPAPEAPKPKRQRAARPIPASATLEIPETAKAEPSSLRQILEALRAQPNDAKLFRALGNGIIKKARAEKKPQIEGRAVSSMMVRDIEGLARCLKELGE